MSQSLPAGLWPSPLTPLHLSGDIRLSDCAWDASGALVWLEGRSDRGALVVQAAPGAAPRDLNDQSVRARVGYGGGDFGVGGGWVYFVEAVSGRVHRQALAGGAAQPVTPAFGSAASPGPSPDGRWVLYVHTYEGRDCLAVVDAGGNSWPRRLAWGDDFYMQPVWSPDTRRVAWVSWNHPNMPWDGTRLYIADLDFPAGDLPRLGVVRCIAGGDVVSVFQPEFSPTGDVLAYASDEDGWWRLYLHHLESGISRPLAHSAGEYAIPAWVQAMRTYAFTPDGRGLFAICNRDGFASLEHIDLASGWVTPQPVGGATWLEQPAVSPDGSRVALLASGSRLPPTVAVVRRGDDNLHSIRGSGGVDLPAETFSAAQAVTWEGEDGDPVHGLFYPPHNPDCTSPDLPPLILMIHHGPTSQATASFNAKVQFFTSRGYAVLEPNFRGSSGYGRAYRCRLNGQWGLLDVHDSILGARRMAELGLVHPQRRVIMGSSSGGYTVLQALVLHPGYFSAGISLYGVSNQFTLVEDTHKFEAHYSETLLGKLPEAAELYRQRSPVFFADRISDPLALFQGEADTVVPPAQSEAIAASLRSRGVPHIYHLYPGEGHGFRKTETLSHFYRAIEDFLLRHVARVEPGAV